jgi:hypothetical protein
LLSFNLFLKSTIGMAPGLLWANTQTSGSMSRCGICAVVNTRYVCAVVYTWYVCAVVNTRYVCTVKNTRYKTKADIAPLCIEILFRNNGTGQANKRCPESVHRGKFRYVVV